MLIEFLKDNKITVLRSFLINQICTPKYANESNIEVGVSYELSLCDALPELKHASQDTGSIKKDAVYLPTTEYLEIKTTTNNFLNNKPYKINYKKKNGNQDNDISSTLPDVMLVYQKFDIEKKIPALIGCIGKEKLKGIVPTGNNSNIYLPVSLTDMEWTCQSNEIYKMKDDFIGKLISLEEEFRIHKRKVKRDLFSECWNGEFVTL